MQAEFQAPQNRNGQEIKKEDSFMSERTVLKPLDQAIVALLVLVIAALMTWVAYTTNENSKSIERLSTQFEGIKQDRDLSLIYIERRLGALEQGVADINERIDSRDRR